MARNAFLIRVSLVRIQPGVISQTLKTVAHNVIAFPEHQDITNEQYHGNVPIYRRIR